MKFGSLFSGIGGFDLGFERAGMVCAWQCEIDKDASKVLKNHWPDVPNIGDVRNVKRNTVEHVDVLCGGFPCQDVSIAGKRAGLAGERSGLWFEFARVIDELGPRTVVIENVPGLLSSNEGRDFAAILSGLVKFGYGVCWRVLDAQFFGVPQRRRRVFIVGSLGDGRAAEILFERESMSGDTPPRRKAGQDVAFSLRANPSRSGDKGDGGVNQTMIAMYETGQGFWQDGDIAGTLRSEGENRPSRPSNVISFMPRKPQMDVLEDISPTMHTGGGGMGAPAVALGLNSKNNRYDGESQTFVIKGAAIGREPEAGPQRGEVLEDGSVYTLSATEVHAIAYNIMPQNSGRDYKAKETDISQNLTTNGNHSGDQGGTYIISTADDQRADRPNGGFYVNKTDIGNGISSKSEVLNVSPMGVRRLTPVECERLQGFPDDWTTGQADTARYRQLGNAVAVPVAEWIGRRIK